MIDHWRISQPIESMLDGYAKVVGEMGSKFPVVKLPLGTFLLLMIILSHHKILHDDSLNHGRI